MTAHDRLTHLEPGMRLLFGDGRVFVVDADLAARFHPGDELRAVEATGEVLLIPAAERHIVDSAVSRAAAAFGAMANVSDDAVASFYTGFADNLEDPTIWKAILDANRADVADAERRGRSTTRLVASDKLRKNMIDGLRGWRSAPTQRGRVLETVQHEGWRAELVGAALGVVAFVFEGRPNVLADATGVLRGGNTVVFRIGRDALGTARTMMEHALTPALTAAGLPEHAAVLVDSAAHAAGWALFSDRRIALAVARGSGSAVATLGSLAQQSGVPASLHGTGGAWLIAADSATPAAVERAVVDSLDRKVCNSLNVCCLPRARAAEFVPAFLSGLEQAGKRRNTAYKLHVLDRSASFVPAALFETDVAVDRADGTKTEKHAELTPEDRLGYEWEWENTPEVTLAIVDDLTEAANLFNRYSPQFIASLLSSNESEHRWFYDNVNAPFVSDGFTRWVDGQFALRRPELGLSNWQTGRLFARGGVLTGDGVFTVRTRARHD